MIQEVLQLGIKGSDLVASQLQKVQKIKAKLAQQTDVRIGMSKKVSAGTSGREVAAVPAGTPEQERFFKKQEARESARASRENSAADYLHTAASVINAAGSFSTNQTAGAVMQGVGSMFGPTGGAIGSFFSSLLSLEGSFVQAMRGASSQVAQLWSGRNQAARYTETHTGESAAGDKAGRSFGIRGDFTDMERGAWISSVGRTMGKFSEEYKGALQKLIGNREQRFDMEQTKELAQGKFSTLGTDKGWFMEQISSSFGNMPPSIRQKLTSQMFGMIGPGERARQIDLESREREAGYTNKDLDKASKQIASDKGLSQTIQNRQNDSDARLTEMLGKLILVLDKISASPLVRALPGTGIFEADKRADAQGRAIRP